MSCIYGTVFDKIFSEVSTYNNRDASEIKHKISDIFEQLSRKFNSGDSFKNHLELVIGLGAIGVAIQEVSGSPELALAPYGIAAFDLVKHVYDSIPENPYAGNGLSPANP